ncbi:AAA family ATPase [Weissella cibaria]|uniref:AAA family ATPase n=1 Tax=Weissella cibaria TaxID=137591 RepID=UPI003CCFF37A
MINSLRVDLPSDIYITGSNASILSGELATLLSGRYVQVDVYPFSFAEFITLKEIDATNKQQVKQAYLEYREFGGMPSVLDAQVTVDNRYDYLSTLYNSIMLWDGR